MCVFAKCGLLCALGALDILGVVLVSTIIFRDLEKDFQIWKKAKIYSTFLLMARNRVRGNV